jgi:DHA2 family methylenomycin A resistance protein-like MFS transporter
MSKRTLTLVVMCVGLFLVLLDVTIVNVALPRIRADLGAGAASLQWIVDGYGIALAALMLPFGDLGDRRGHKRVVLTGLAVFGAGSLGAGTIYLVAAIPVMRGSRARRRRPSARGARPAPGSAP